MKKRIISVLTIFCLIFSLGAVPVGADGYYDYEYPPVYIYAEATPVSDDNIVTVTAYLMTDEDIQLSGIQLELSQQYSRPLYKRSIKAIRGGETFPNYSTSNVTDSGSQDGDSLYSPVHFRFLWESLSDITVSKGTTEIFSVDFEVESDSPDGLYLFNFECKDMYRHSEDSEDQTYDIPFAYYGYPDLDPKTSPYEVIFKKGEDMEIYPSPITIPAGGSSDLYSNKEVKEWDSFDSRIAEIDNNGHIVAKKTGTTYIFAYYDYYSESVGGYYTESSICPVTVTEPQLWFFNIVTPPTKTEYLVGEKFDPAGLTLFTGYDSGVNETIEPNSDFKYEYDFSFAGEKQVKVIYKNSYVYFTVNVSQLDGIHSDRFEVADGLIYKIPSGTSVAELLNSIAEKDLVKIMSGNTEVTDGYVSTGMRAVLSVDGVERYSADIAVSGDINGDGEVNILDLISLKKIASDLKTASKAQIAAAADSATATSVTAADLVKMKRRLIGIGDSF